MKTENQHLSRKALSVLTIKFLLVAAAFVASLFAFGFIAREAVFEREDIFDQQVSQFLVPYTSPPVISLMRFFTFFGSTWFLLPAYVILIVLLLIRKEKRNALNVAIIGSASTVLIFGLKSIFRRARPDLPLIRSLKTFSFPSGHAVSSFIFCSVLVYLVWNSRARPAAKWIFSILLLFFSLMVGLSRIILKMHFATDVIAGFCLGIAWVLLSFWLMKKTERGKLAAT